jgi:hypothetical protein
LGFARNRKLRELIEAQMAEAPRPQAQQQGQPAWVFTEFPLFHRERDMESRRAGSRPKPNTWTTKENPRFAVTSPRRILSRPGVVGITVLRRGDIETSSKNSFLCSRVVSAQKASANQLRVHFSANRLCFAGAVALGTGRNQVGTRAMLDPPEQAAQDWRPDPHQSAPHSFVAGQQLS